MTTIHLNKLSGQWQSTNYAMSLSKSRIIRLCYTNKEEAISVGFWDRFCDLFRPEKKARVLAAVWDFIHAADNNVSGKMGTLLPENAIKTFLLLKDLSDKPDAFVAELKMITQEQGRYYLLANFRINNNMLCHVPFSFTNEAEMGNWIRSNTFIRTEKCNDNNELTKQILEIAVQNGINLRKINLEKAILRQINLISAKLPNANLRNADLRYNDLRSANLQDADLQDADLRDADLRDADLQNADLRNADLRGAKLDGIKNLQGFYLKGAKMKGATYNGKPLTSENIKAYFPDAIPQFINWE
ncbi:hypothetical protein F9222_24920 [Escherichia coli]|nr:hypothetical protein F9222_24920 [Escherichia coli]